MRLAFYITIALACVFIPLGIIMGLGAWKTFYGPGPLTQEVFVVIPNGQGLVTITQNLHRAGIISSPILLQCVARVKGQQAMIKAGEYRFTPAMSMAHVLDILVKGQVVVRRLTIPEGLTSYEIVERLRAETFLTGDIVDIPREGSLLPETYTYRRNDTRLTIIKQMKAAMEGTLREIWPMRDKNVSLTTVEEALVLASVVEKETSKSSEYARVAGVFMNRLRVGMKLQSDPTVIYALTQGKPENAGQGPLGRRLLSRDLTVLSPYNTYLYAGLPPKPIAAPGRAALEATLHPETHKYLYFVADGTGGHVFATTLAEHNHNVARWRAARRK